MNEDRRRFFTELIRRDSFPMEPAPVPPLPDRFEKLVYPGSGKPLENIKAILFDVYGTLFTSAAGDIASQPVYMRGNLDALALELGGGYTGEELKDYFRKSVLETHGELFPRTPFPEVRVEDIWSRFSGRPEGMDGEELALRYELALNPVFPMPGAESCVRELAAAGMVLGIISNAQFFTPLLFDALFGHGPEDLGFSKELCIYSYETGEAKPAPSLFAPAGEYLMGLGIGPEETVFIGNDMLNDIYGAAAAGFRTILFAGDGRSLRLREENALTGHSLPDGVIRHLGDLAPAIGCRC